MKKLFLMLAALPFFAACDSVGPDDRYIEVENVSAERKVLLEEFTGQRCVNCPTAHAIIERLEEQYGDDLIVVSIHAGSDQNAISVPFGLKQTVGDIYANHWGIDAYPAGVVDRSGGKLGYDAWATAIREDLAKPTPLRIDVSAMISNSGNTPVIEIATELNSSANINGSLQLWVVENGIVALQTDKDLGRIPDYVHNNVFRACVNGEWGQSITLEANSPQEISNSISVHENSTYEVDNWNLDNLYIVAFYYNDSGVVQVERCKVLNP